ncbi:protein plant cadmium resistance 10 [Phtheirospermum japonicum]|uniref:Protein plant cadmium resistance 10 n=1 Tax=Phtheirospermum japonicum TaxID=374723 RepID=A0A830BI71_9LAMI|nr:protein plant cadmium resistance 10 [Phtheirospermum japonicum]
MVSNDNGDVSISVGLTDDSNPIINDAISKTRPNVINLAYARERLKKCFPRKIDRNHCQEWIRDPFNLALSIWIVCVAISGTIQLMLAVGMLNCALPTKSQRDVWSEVNNQILNALFTLMCVYQHPKIIRHTVLLLRWRPDEDVLKLRSVYCKDGTCKPRERAHMMAVVVLLHVNFLAQYVSCGLYLCYNRSDRPAVGVGISMGVTIGAPAVAGGYTLLSPLGRDYETKMDSIAGAYIMLSPLGRDNYETGTDVEAQIPVTSGSGPVQWSGGVFDFWDDVSVACLSLFCCFCVLGRNMERLGFGNKYVHIATFVLFCMAPFWVFHLAAISIENGTVREVFGVFGILLCVFGLLYGGFWRIQMRKRFNLPEYGFCCNKPVAADLALWLFCWWCSLAQEVRTGNAYDIVEDKFCRKKEELTMMSPLDRENGEFEVRSSRPSPSVRFSNEHESKDDTMRPPSSLMIRREEI